MTDLSRRHAPGRLLGVAGTVVLFAGAVVGTARVGTVALLAVVGVAQLVLMIGWLRVTAPPSPRGVAVVGVGTGIAADGVAVLGEHKSLAPLAGVVGLAVLVTMVVQLARGVARARVTEALASTLTVAVGMTALSTLLVLVRLHGGRAAVIATALAAGVALLTARCVDLVLPVPHLAAAVDRGGLGIILGSMAGTAVSAYYASTVPVLTTQTGALLGWAVALVATLSDLSTSYALVSAPRHRAYSFIAGPLVALTAAAPVAYLLGLLVVS